MRRCSYSIMQTISERLNSSCFATQANAEGNAVDQRLGRRAIDGSDERLAIDIGKQHLDSYNR